MTPEEQLDEATVEEAKRRLVNSGKAWGPKEMAALAARLARENWTPPEPEVDPDILAFREWLAGYHNHNPAIREEALAGTWDKNSQAAAFLAGARMAREKERERADWLVRAAKELAGRFRHLRHSLPLGVRAQFGVKWDLDEAFVKAVEAGITEYEEGKR